MICLRINNFMIGIIYISMKLPKNFVSTRLSIALNKKCKPREIHFSRMGLSLGESVKCICYSKRCAS